VCGAFSFSSLKAHTSALSDYDKILASRPTASSSTRTTVCV
jgi:hypothetical protein